MSSFFRLIRYQNLLIIIAVQYLMRLCILKPFLRLNGFHLQLDEFHFLLLVLTTVLIAAAGYIINDYFDIRTDKINKPDRVIIGNQISRRVAIALHIGLSLTGIISGIYLSIYIGILPLSLIFMLCAGALWFYSTTYKRQFLIGNLVVSLMTGGVPFLVAIYEIPLLNKAYGELMIQNNVNFNYIFYWIGGFSFFAFYTNFIREIIKDAEDFEGDSIYGMKTLPVFLGIKFTKIILASLIFILLFMLTFILKFIVFSSEKTDMITAVYFIFFLLIPVSILLYIILTANTKNDYRKASNLMKLIMLTGMCYAVLVNYIVAFQIK